MFTAAFVCCPAPPGKKCDGEKQGWCKFSTVIPPFSWKCMDLMYTSTRASYYTHCLWEKILATFVWYILKKNSLCSLVCFVVLFTEWKARAEAIFKWIGLLNHQIQMHMIGVVWSMALRAANVSKLKLAFFPPPGNRIKSSKQNFNLRFPWQRQISTLKATSFE